MIPFQILLILLLSFIVIKKIKSAKKKTDLNTENTIAQEKHPNIIITEDFDCLELQSYTASKGTPKKGKRIKAVKKQIKDLTEESIEVANTPSKNKWLYPSDELGTLEEGVEWNSRTYTYNQKDKDNGFEIN